MRGDRSSATAISVLGLTATAGREHFTAGGASTAAGRTPANESRSRAPAVRKGAPRPTRQRLPHGHPALRDQPAAPESRHEGDSTAVPAVAVVPPGRATCWAIMAPLGSQRDPVAPCRGRDVLQLFEAAYRVIFASCYAR
jgi:hypothetical protein